MMLLFEEKAQSKQDTSKCFTVIADYKVGNIGVLCMQSAVIAEYNTGVISL